MLTALEGNRAIPRAKPPYPQISGLWGKPTVVNNVETLCQRAAHRQSRRRVVPRLGRTAKTAAPRSTAPAAG